MAGAHMHALTGTFLQGDMPSVAFHCKAVGGPDKGASRVGTHPPAKSAMLRVGLNSPSRVMRATARATGVRHGTERSPSPYAFTHLLADGKDRPIGAGGQSS
ncbi:hypothetical protein GCM10010431_40100 [Streptomyces kunmingensis]